MLRAAYLRMDSALINPVPCLNLSEKPLSYRTKASSIALDELIHENSNCVRFDYRGHGRSSGAFEEMSLCEWCATLLCLSVGQACKS